MELRKSSAEPLVRQYLARARKQAHDDRSYGGSTGGRSSLDAQGSGLNVLMQRAAEAKDKRKVFDEGGGGTFGARAEAWRARQYPDLGT